MLPNSFYNSCRFGIHFNAGLAFSPLHFGDCRLKGFCRQDLVGGRIHHAVPLHIHIIGPAALARPVLVLVRVRSEGSNANDSCRSFVSDLYENKTVTTVSLLVLNYAPIKEIRRTVPVIIISRQHVLAVGEIEILQKAVQLIAGEIWVPIRERYTSLH